MVRAGARTALRGQRPRAPRDRPGTDHAGAPRAGRASTVALEVGRRVDVGELLVALDPGALPAHLERARGQLDALGAERASIERELAAERTAVSAGDAAGRAAIREQLARVRAADQEVERAATELARAIALGDSGVTATSEVDQARTELARRRAARDALGHAAAGLAASESERDAGRQGRVAELERQRATIDGSLAAARTEVARLEIELAQHEVRAPIAGVLGSIAPLRPGAWVEAGAALATIVPDSVLQLVAELPPSALGRLAVGQPARLKLDGFPWTRWGTVTAQVTRIASEVRDGTIRVELDLAPGASLPLVNGMTGTVEIEVESVNPASLLVRSLAAPRTNAP